MHIIKVTNTRPLSPQLLIGVSFRNTAHTNRSQLYIHDAYINCQAKPNATMAPIAPATKTGPLVTIAAAA